MGLRREYVRLLSRKIVEDLKQQEMIVVPEGLDLAEQLFQIMDAEINLEDKINEEVRTLLNQYQDQMRQSGASYQEMFKLIKNKKKSIKPPGIKSRPRSAQFPKAAANGKSSIVSIMKKKCGV